MYTENKILREENNCHMFKNILLVCVGLVVIGVGYYFISPLFIKIQLNEPAPIARNESVITLQNKTDTNQTQSQTANQGSANRPTLSTNPVENSAPAITPVSETLRNAPIIETKGHPASGTARLLVTDTGTVIRFENFTTVNGPDLFVYLATDLEATDFIDLGRLKATEGNINYAVPNGVDVAKYPYVMVWCKQFGVLFNYADISSL